MKNWILPLNNKTLNNLKEKHQESKDANNAVLLTSASQRIHPKQFAGINEEMVKKAAIKLKGGSGPSVIDSGELRNILCYNNVVNAKADLRIAIAIS